MDNSDSLIDKRGVTPLLYSAANMLPLSKDATPANLIALSSSRILRHSDI
jgi:hypothetical protein